MDALYQAAPRFRLSIRGLFAITAALAVAFGAVFFANEWWLIVLLMLVSLGTVAAIIIALLDQGPRRAFAIGLLAYMAVSIFLLPEINDIGRRSPAGALFQWLYPLVADPAPRNPRNRQSWSEWEMSPGRYQQQYFLPVGEQLWTLALAVASGYFAQYVYAKRRRAEPGAEA